MIDWNIRLFPYQWGTCPIFVEHRFRTCVSTTCVSATFLSPKGELAQLTRKEHSLAKSIHGTGAHHYLKVFLWDDWCLEIIGTPDTSGLWMRHMGCVSKFGTFSNMWAWFSLETQYVLGNLAARCKYLEQCKGLNREISVNLVYWILSNYNICQTDICSFSLRVGVGRWRWYPFAINSPPRFGWSFARAGGAVEGAACYNCSL